MTIPDCRVQKFGIGQKNFVTRSSARRPLFSQILFRVAEEPVLLEVLEGKRQTLVVLPMTRRMAVIPAESKGSLSADHEENQLLRLRAWRTTVLERMMTVLALLQLQAGLVAEGPAQLCSLQPLLLLLQ